MNNKYKLTEIELDALPALESTVLRIRYGIWKREDYPLHQNIDSQNICAGLTRDRFRHIEARAMVKILTSRHYPEGGC